MPTFAPYRLVSIESSIRLGGFTRRTFTADVESVIKKTLVSVISSISDTDQIISVHAENITNAAGVVTEVDVHFTLEVRLEGVVARTNDDDDGRRLTTEYSGSTANLTNSFPSLLLCTISLNCGILL